MHRLNSVSRLELIFTKTTADGGYLHSCWHLASENGIENAYTSF